MENIALTTIFLLILAIPGYIALSTYHTGKLTKAVLPRDLAGDLLKAFLVSLPIHWIGIVIVEHLHEVWGIIPDINFGVAARLFTGSYQVESELLSQDVENLYQYSHVIQGYIGFLIILSVLTGLTIRELVWRHRLDLKFPNIFGFRNLWLYPLTGRKLLPGTPSDREVIPVVDALAKIGEKTRLYRGVVWDFSTDQTGNLKELFLIESLRGKFRKGTEGGDVFYWETIPGDIFVVKYSEILNLNIMYLPVLSWPPPNP